MSTGPAWAWFLWALSVVAMMVGLVWFAWWLDRFQDRHAARRRTPSAASPAEPAPVAPPPSEGGPDGS